MAYTLPTSTGGAGGHSGTAPQAAGGAGGAGYGVTGQPGGTGYDSGSGGGGGGPNGSGGAGGTPNGGTAGGAGGDGGASYFSGVTSHAAATSFKGYSGNPGLKPADNSSGDGAGGGGGGAGGYAILGATNASATVTVSNGAIIYGGAGGRGGDGGAATNGGAGAGGAGGDGGQGIHLSTGSVTISTPPHTVSFVQGGQGGAGGAGGTGTGGAGGAGGNGGAGVVIANHGYVQIGPNAAVAGGYGGYGGAGANGSANGAGGVGIAGANLTVVDGGFVQGNFLGTYGNGPEADAIDFAGGAGKLTMAIADSNAQSGYDFGQLSGDIGVAGSLQIDPGVSAGSYYELDSVVKDYDVGGGSVEKIGAGKLILAATETYTGATTVTAGTLALAVGGSISASSGVAVASGATFDVSAIDDGVSITSLSGAGSVVLAAGSSQSTLVLTDAAGTFSGVLSGAGGGLEIHGGAETLTGASTYDGVTTVDAGATLVLGAGGSLADSDVHLAPSASTGPNTPPQFGAVLELNADASIGGLSGLNSSCGSEVNLGSHTLTLIAPSGDVFAGDILGSGALDLAGGVESLAYMNTYSGGTTVSHGVLDLDYATALNGSTISSGAAGTGAIHFGAAATLEIEHVALGTDAAHTLAYQLTGFTDGDVIDLRGVTTTDTVTYNASTGQLQVMNGSAVEATLNIGTGYGGDTFTATADTSSGGAANDAASTGGIDIRVTTPALPPPSGGGGGGGGTTTPPPGDNPGVTQTGSAQPSTLQGTSGDDTLTAGSSGDTLMGGGGNDSLVTGSGHDVIFGQMGDDHIVVDAASQGASVYGGQGNDTIDESHSNAPNYVSGDIGNDTIMSGAGFETVLGGQGDDVVVGGTTAGPGSMQYLFGNQGNDHLSYAGSGGVELFGGQDSDTISLTATQAGQVRYAFGNLGTDALTATGGADSLYGGQGDDVVSAANDTVGHNYLSGDLGNDVVTGSRGGMDTLHGGQGADTVTLTAHAAANGDRVVVGAGESTATSALDESNLQHILGFTSGSDHVVLSGHAALSVGVGGNLTTYVGGANASETAAFSAAYTYAYGDGGANASHIGATEYLAVQESYGSTTATYLFTADHHVVGLVGVSASGLQSGDVLAG